jgi:hypothetical protein
MAGHRLSLRASPVRLARDHREAECSSKRSQCKR